jgi:hypothetical protein
MKSFLRLGAALAVLVLSVGTARAQDAAEDVTNLQYVPGEEVKDLPQGLQDGWHPTLTLGANLNLASNSSVVGQPDGFSLLVGVSVLGDLLFIAGDHDWKNTLKLTETWTRTPVVDEFVKSNDVLDVESLYRFFAWTWGGPFARLSLQTPIFAAEQVSAEPQTYVLEGEDPATDGITTDRFDLADPFQPLTVTESIGAFVAPVATPRLNVAIRAGFGGRHTFADGARLITNADDPAAVTYVDLLDVHQAGVELFAGIDGKTAEDRLAYNVGLAVLVPFLNNDERDRDGFELTRIALEAGLTTNVFDWMSLSYQLRIVDDPQLLDAVQIQNNLLLTFAFTVTSAEPPAEPAVEDAQSAAAIAAAEERARLAEERARLAEERARLAEERGNEATQPAPAPAPPAEPVPGAPEPAPAPAPGPAPAPEPAPTPQPTPAPNLAP